MPPYLDHLRLIRMACRCTVLAERKFGLR